MITLSALPAVGTEVSVPNDSGRTRTFKVVRVASDGFWTVDETGSIHCIDVTLVAPPPVVPLSPSESRRQVREVEEQKKVEFKNERDRLESAAWAQRQSEPFSRFGSAAVLQPNFLDWLKAAKKLVSTKVARVDVAWMESPETYRRKKDEKPSQPFLDTVTLDFVGEQVAAYIWTVSGDYVGLSALPTRLLCRCYHPFVVRVHLPTLVEVVALCPKERLDLSGESGELRIVTPRNVARLYSHPIYPIVERFWLPQQGAAPVAQSPRRRSHRRSSARIVEEARA